MRYEPGDVVTFYFIIMKKDGKKSIVAWSDNKKIAKAYLEFHKCKYFYLIEHTSTIEEMYKLTDENINDEIKLTNIAIRDVKNPNKVKYVVMPGTDIDFTFVKDESSSFYATRIDYQLLEEAYYSLKNKYREAFEDIYLKDIINYVIYRKHSKISSMVQFDELSILTKGFPEKFGL